MTSIAAPTLDYLGGAIREADYRGAARSFCALVKQGEPAARLMQAALDATAPFIQVPAHLMVQPTGEVRGVNYDHTVLGWRASLRLSPYLPTAYQRLPQVQAVWYAPQGLDVWGQIRCEFPGHYARDQERCDEKAPAPINSFDGPAWRPPQTRFPDQTPLVERSPEHGQAALREALLSGDRERAYRLFLGLAPDPSQRAALKDTVLFASIIDLQETIIQRGGYQNIGHKALRARALGDLADALGWENAHGVFYGIVPDLNTAPQLHALWHLAQTLIREQFPETGRELKRLNQAPLTADQQARLTDLIIWGAPAELTAYVTELLTSGCALLAIADVVSLAYCRYLVEQAEQPKEFFTPQHAFDYCNVVNHWLRTYDNPHQAKAPYFQALFVQDVIRANRLLPPDPALALPPAAEFKPRADSLPLEQVLAELDAAVVVQEPARAAALVESYCARTDERARLIATLGVAAEHFQNDPHITRACVTAIEEWQANRLPGRDLILVAWAKYAARCIKRTLAQDCYELYVREFVAS